MLELGHIVEMGAIGLALLAVLMLIDFIKKRFGNGKAQPVVEDRRRVVDEIEKTLGKMLLNLDTSTRTLSELLHVVEENRIGIREVEHLANLHGAGSRSEKVREESRDLLRDIVTILERNGFKR